MMNINDPSMFYQKKLNAQIFPSVLTFVDVIKKRTQIKRFGKELSFADSFRYCLTHYGSQLLYYPCKPSYDDHLNYPPESDLLAPVDPSVSCFSHIENELNAGMENGIKYFTDIHNPFYLTSDLHSKNFSHSTILDFVFAHATDKGDNCTLDFLDSFLDLCNDKPRFLKELSPELLEQAMANSTKEVQQYVVDQCKDFKDFLPERVVTKVSTDGEGKN